MTISPTSSGTVVLANSGWVSNGVALSHKQQQRRSIEFNTPRLLPVDRISS